MLTMLRKQDWWRSNWWLIAFLAVIPLSLLIEPTKLSTSPTFVMWLLIPFTGLAGYAFFYNLSNVIANQQGKMAIVLSYIGRQTFYIMTFHFLMFKPASLLKTYLLGLDWRMIGCHPVIPPVGDNWYWLVYSITSIILSIVFAEIVERIPFSKLNYILKKK